MVKDLHYLIIAMIDATYNTEALLSSSSDNKGLEFGQILSQAQYGRKRVPRQPRTPLFPQPVTRSKAMALTQNANTQLNPLNPRNTAIEDVQEHQTLEKSTSQRTVRCSVVHAASLRNKASPPLSRYTYAATCRSETQSIIIFNCSCTRRGNCSPAWFLRGACPVCD